MSKSYKTKKKASRMGFGGSSKRTAAAPVLVRNCRWCKGTHELGACPVAKW